MKSFALVLGAALFCLILLSLLIESFDPCGNIIKAEVTSPDGKYIATAFIRNCGATTAFSPQVHLRPAGERLAKTGNVFIGDGSQRIEISWLSATQLVIVSNCQTIQQVTNLHGVVIEKRDAK